MTDEAPQTETVEQPDAELVDGTPEPTQPNTPGELQAELEAVRKALQKANRESAERRKKLEAFEQAEQKRKESEMSEIDRLKAQAEAAERKAAEMERREWQRQAAEAAGVPASLADRIRGDDLQAMIEDAKALAGTLPKPKANVSPTNPGGGSSPKETDEERRKRLFG